MVSKHQSRFLEGVIESPTVSTQDEDLCAGILQGAEAVIMRSGIRNLRMDDVARELRISKKTIYRCYSSKAELMDAVVDSVLRTAEAQFSAVRHDAALATVAKIRASFTVAHAVFRRIGERVLEDLAYSHRDLWQRVDTRRRSILHTHFQELIRAGRNEGVVRSDLDTALTVTVLVRALTRVIRPDELVELPYPIEAVFDNLMTLLITGVLTERGRTDFQAEV